MKVPSIVTKADAPNQTSSTPCLRPLRNSCKAYVGFVPLMLHFSSSSVASTPTIAERELLKKMNCHRVFLTLLMAVASRRRGGVSAAPLKLFPSYLVFQTHKVIAPIPSQVII